MNKFWEVKIQDLGIGPRRVMETPLVLITFIQERTRPPQIALTTRLYINTWFPEISEHMEKMNFLSFREDQPDLVGTRQKILIFLRHVGLRNIPDLWSIWIMN